MKKNPARYTITSALPYANGPVHIGHLAGVYVPADIYARYLRNNGKEVLFLGGEVVEEDEELVDVFDFLDSLLGRGVHLVRLLHDGGIGAASAGEERKATDEGCKEENNLFHYLSG